MTKWPTTVALCHSFNKHQRPQRKRGWNWCRDPDLWGYWDFSSLESDSPQEMTVEFHPADCHQEGNRDAEECWTNQAKYSRCEASQFPTWRAFGFHQRTGKPSRSVPYTGQRWCFWEPPEGLAVAANVDRDVPNQATGETQKCKNDCGVASPTLQFASTLHALAYDPASGNLQHLWPTWGHMSGLKTLCDCDLYWFPWLLKVPLWLGR